MPVCEDSYDSEWGEFQLQERSTISSLEIRQEIPNQVSQVQVKRGDQIKLNHLQKIFKLGPQTLSSKENLTKEFRIYRYRNPNTKRSLKILKCDFANCAKFFRKFHNFYDHLRIHTGERPYGCPYAKQFNCHLRFTQKSNLNKHIKCHLDTDTLDCEICGKQFKNTNYLKVSIP